MELLRNTRKLPSGPALASLVRPFGVEAANSVLRLLACCPAYEPSPLLRLSSLAGDLELRDIAFKDESMRLRLGSFKALGGVYAIVETVRRLAGATYGPIDAEEIMSERIKRLAAKVTFTCASDGNHGRAVAAGARLFGAGCVVFLHERVSRARCDRIAALGAQIVRMPGTYDHSVEAAEAAARDKGWILIADTTDDPRDEVPSMIMKGYTVVFREALGAQSETPTHLFIQAGVGGLAAAASAYCTNHYGAEGPKIVVVEPERANSLLESCRAGHLVDIPSKGPTVYAMLECLRPSRPAWDILDATCDFFMDVPEEDAAAAMRRLRYPAPPDPPIVCGESGVTGLVGLIAACSRNPWRRQLGITAESRVLLIGTEGAADEENAHGLSA
jgi:diaminopropionate ammonia-lyase